MSLKNVLLLNVSQFCAHCLGKMKAKWRQQVEDELKSAQQTAEAIKNNPGW